MWQRLERKISFLNCFLFVYLFFFFFFCYPHFSFFFFLIFLLSAFFFSIRIFLSAFSHPHPPSAGIRSAFYRHPFSVLLFLFVHEHQHFSEAALKCDIVRKEDNYKYLVALFTHHLGGRFTFSVFFSCKSVFGLFTTRSSSFHSYSATLSEYDMWKSKKYQ